MLDEYALSALRGQTVRASHIADEAAAHYDQLEQTTHLPLYTSAAELSELAERLHRFSQWIDAYIGEAAELESERRTLQDAAQDVGLTWSGDTSDPVTNTYGLVDVSVLDHSNSMGSAVVGLGLADDCGVGGQTTLTDDLVEREDVVTRIAAWTHRAQALTTHLRTESATLSEAFVTLR